MIYDENLAIFLEKLGYEHREYSSDASLLVDSVSTDPEASYVLVSSNLTDSNSVVIVEI